MLFGLRFWSSSPYANNTSRMNRSEGTEKPRSWKATNDTTYPPGRAWHGFVDRNDPLNDLGEGRQLARLNETKKLLAGDSGARPTRHHAGEVSGELGTRAAAVM
jgi:hypothetical protein